MTFPKSAGPSSLLAREVEWHQGEAEGEVGVMFGAFGTF